MAPMMRKSNRRRSRAHAALLLSQIVALLVCHERNGDAPDTSHRHNRV
jgi:hypothetical protein